MSLRLTSEQYAEHQARLARLLHPLREVERNVTRTAIEAGYAPLVGLCRAAGLPEPVPEYRFHATRRWRFDYAFPLHLLALEIEGGQWVNGRHNRASGQIADLEKYSEAAILGWRLLYATPDELRNGTALHRVQRALAHERSPP